MNGLEAYAIGAPLYSQLEAALNCEERGDNVLVDVPASLSCSHYPHHSSCEEYESVS